MTRNSILSSMLVVAVFIFLAIPVYCVPVIRTAAGANPAAIQATVDLFRADLGGANNGVGGSFTTGRREINWDGVPDAFSSPNNLPLDFFNVNSPRGVVFSAIHSFTQNLRVSANSTNPTNTPVRFGDLDPSYPAQFQTFSAQRLFGVVGNNSDQALLEVVFFIPGTKIPATVSGFGLVFADVDYATNGFAYYGPDGKLIGAAQPAVANGGLSFIGVTFDAGERISRVLIFGGEFGLGPGHVDTPPDNDIIAMDDFIYGEPHALDFHTGDFDGDGVTDSNIFRPSTGTWFILNSGTNTANIVQWGQNGDIPVDGDFDGDRVADQAIFRPSDGSWWIHKSSDGQAIITAFGANGDKPVTGDYDKDGKTDIAFWRPSNGNFFIARSSTGFATFFGYGFGQAGDIPVQGAAQ